MYVHFILFYRHLSLPWGLYLRLFITLYMYNIKFRMYVDCVYEYVGNVCVCLCCNVSVRDMFRTRLKGMPIENRNDIARTGGVRRNDAVCTLNILKIISFLLLFQKYVICMDF